MLDLIPTDFSRSLVFRLNPVEELCVATQAPIAKLCIMRRLNQFRPVTPFVRHGIAWLYKMLAPFQRSHCRDMMKKTQICSSTDGSQILHTQCKCIADLVAFYSKVRSVGVESIKMV
jgi:hypothetical protein